VIHFLVGHAAANQLQAAFALDENLSGEILVLQDTLGIGPLQRSEGQTFRQLRTDFWKTLDPHFKEEVEDQKRVLLTIARALREEEPICFWMAPCVSDVCAYFWLIPFFKDHPGMFHIININSLPFLNEKGQLFYPKNFSEVLPKEFVKTKRLLKEVTPAEYEVDVDEWKRLEEENTWVRVYEGGKKIISKPETHFDSMILNSVAFDFTKAHKVVHDVLKKNTQTLSDKFLEWRIRELIASGQLLVQGDSSKGFKEFEIKKAGKSGGEEDDATSESSAKEIASAE
jgi:hypothetical protein